MTTLYLVRHCEARGNADRLFQGFTDAEISENGSEQLKCLTGRFETLHFNRIYSSPLKRAKLTADAVNRWLELPVVYDEGLKEINGGHWEGKRWADFPVIYPEEAYCWNKAPWDFAPVDGETMRELFTRISTTANKIVEKNIGETTVIVSHGCAIRNLLCYFKGYPIERLNDVDWSDNTAVSKIEFDDRLNANIIYENDTEHLNEEISTFAKQSWWQKENRNKSFFD